MDLGAELRELQTDALRLVLVALAALAVGVYYYLSTVTNSVDAVRFGFLWGLLAVAGLTYLLLTRGAAPATGVLLAGLSLNLAAALLVTHQSTLAYWYSPIVIIGGVLLGWRSGAVVALQASVVIALAQRLLGFVPGEVAIGAILLTWVSLLLCWLLSQPTQSALDWAWHNYVRVARITAELREHQERLGRTIKSLNVAYERLEQLNLELARARQAAETARRHKSEFAAAISHELRTPLNLIIGFSELMVVDQQAYGGQVLPETYRGDLEAIYRNASHLSSLVDDVLDLSQIEADRMALQKERLRLALVVDEAVAVVARLFTAKGLAIHLDVPLDLPPVNADRTRIRQVLINILSNAARFTAQGSITIRASAEGTDVVVAIADTGSGIAPEHLSAVFDEFRQIQVLGERRVVGSGLGLAVSKRFVELHGGSMWVASQPGVGSTFFFSLPTHENVIATAKSVTDDPSTVAPPTNRPAERTIVVIDRDGEAARLLCRHLDDVRILVAPPGEGARRIARENVVDAAILVTPHGPPEWSALRQIGETFPGIPVAICALSTRPVAVDGLGIVDCLLKPIGPEQVRHALRRLGRSVRTILVVDDDPEMVRLLTRYVARVSRRYTVWGAPDGPTALALLANGRPDAVFLDLVMPGVGGDELLRHLRTTPELQDVPVVLVTGHGLADERVTAEFFAITQKDGFTTSELMRSLRSSLEAVYRPQTTLLQHLQQRASADGLG
jgi:signal transduction histidine kinase/CheY-like chemotaxis protein